jgi:hypothetical protein
LKDNYIHVGSKRFGFYCHNIKYTDNKDILIGYICIEYNENETTNKLTINSNNSFIIKPKCNYTQKDQRKIDDDYYYKYIEDLSTDKQKAIISINKDLCYIIKLHILPININIKFDCSTYHIIPPPKALVFYKYLKYKTRYISLKNILNKNIR